MYVKFSSFVVVAAVAIATPAANSLANPISVNTATLNILEIIVDRMTSARLRVTFFNSAQISMAAL
jgi:hypothetical protein